MSNHRDEERGYAAPRGGMAGGIALMLAALLIGAIVLQMMNRKRVTTVDAGPTVSVAGVTETTTTLPLDSSGIPVGGEVTPPVTSRTPAQVRVMVVNGTTTGKAALRVSEALKPGGWAMTTPKDAVTKNRDNAVYYKPGFEAEAAIIRESLKFRVLDKNFGPSPEDPLVKAPVPSFDIMVQIGPELSQAYPPAASAAPVGAVDPAAGATPAPAANGVTDPVPVQ